MIKASELRIGNLLEIAGETIAVTSIDDDSLGTTSYFNGRMGMNDCLCANASPIPITKEWLNKLSCGPISASPATCYIDLDQGREFSGIYIDHIKYVHQLQNLHFALTGNELQILE